MIKKLISLLVTVAILFSFAACVPESETEQPISNDTTTTGSQTTKTTTTTAKAVTTTPEQTTTGLVNPFAEKMEISWLVGIYTSHLYVEGRWDELELEEKFNVDLKMWNVMVDSGNMEQVIMMLAAGDVPDYGFYYRSGKDLYPQGLTRTISEEMIKNYFPSYYALFEKEPIGRLFNKVEDAKDPNFGQFYHLMMLTHRATHSGHVPMWRLDWLEDLGYQLDDLVPVRSEAYPQWNNRVFLSTTKFSTDDVKDILKAFTEDDPDGNGEDDTYGSGLSNLSLLDCYISYAMFGFDQANDHMYKDTITGDYVPFYVYTPYRDMLGFLTEMLDAGYIRRLPGEQSVNNEFMALWSTGKTGYMNTLNAPRVLGFGGNSEDWPPASILANEDDARFVVTRPPESGKFRPYATFNWVTTGNQCYTIGINVTDEKLERLFHLLEYAYFGENFMRYKWGIEGVHYKWSGERLNSAIIITDETKIPPKYAGIGTTKGFGQFGNLHFVNDNKVYMSFDAFYIQVMDYWDIHNPGGYHDDSLWIRPDKLHSEVTMPEDLFKEFKTIRDETINEINVVRNEFTKKVWEGQIANLNTEWAQYIEQIYAAGIKDWVRIFNNDEVKTFAYYNSKK